MHGNVFDVCYSHSLMLLSAPFSSDFELWFHIRACSFHWERMDMKCNGMGRMGKEGETRERNGIFLICLNNTDNVLSM